MKNHRFLWLRNRTTNNRKCEKARNIKEKRTIEMFSTVSKAHAVHLSSANVNHLLFIQALHRRACFCFKFVLKNEYIYLLYLTFIRGRIIILLLCF